MSRVDKIWVGVGTLILVALVSLAGMSLYSRGYSTGSLDTQTRWSSITDRCIAKLESTLVIARSRP